MRKVFRSVTTLVTLLSADVAQCQVRPAVTDTAAASNVVPANWTRKETPRGTVYSFGVNGAAVMFGQTPVSAMPQPAAVAQSLERPSGCPGISRAPVTEAFPGRGVRIQTTEGATLCTVLIGASDTVAFVVIAVEQASAGAHAGALAQTLFARAMRIAAPTPQSDTYVSAPATVSDAMLRAALASVPVANRPIAMPTRRETRSSGGYNFVVYKPWMAFANGYATDSRCYDWDPRTLAPTPQSLGAAGKRCDLVRWRRVGNAMQFEKADGTWESDAKGAVLYPFTPGLRLDRTLENAGGTGSAPGVGAIAVNTVFRGGLQMTAAGTMQSDWRNDTAISGAGIGGGASGSGTYLAGRYFADGYLIAVADARGTLSVAFIAGSHDEGEPRYTHIYLNGRQYWPGDR
jgi:hypothetical protein